MRTRRRRRSAFTGEQFDRLEECCTEETFPGITIKEELAQELNIKEDRIQVKQFGNCSVDKISRAKKLGV